MALIVSNHCQCPARCHKHIVSMLAPVQVSWVGVVGAGVALSVGRRVGLAEVGEEEASVAMLIVFVAQEVG